MKFVASEPITVGKMMKMTMNDIAIEEATISGKMANINPENKERRNRRWITNKLSLLSTTFSSTPGNDLKKDQDGIQYFDSEFAFPDGAWNNNYMPIVVISPVGDITVKRTVVILSITPTKVGFRTYFLDNDASRQENYEYSLTAIGVGEDDYFDI